MLNKFLGIGNLTKDPFYSVTKTEVPCCSFTMAINYNGKKEATFIKIKCYGKQANTHMQYLKKGSKVFVEGILKIDSSTDNDINNIKYNYYPYIVANNVTYLNTNNTGNSSDDDLGF